MFQTQADKQKAVERMAFLEKAIMAILNELQSILIWIATQVGNMAKWLMDRALELFNNLKSNYEDWKQQRALVAA